MRNLYAFMRGAGPAFKRTSLTNQGVNKIGRFIHLFALLFAIAWLPVARAEFILGNNQPVNNDGQLYTFDSTIHYAIGITVGAAPLQISDLTLRLGAANNPVVASIELRTDPDAPGTALGSLNVTGPAIQNYVFNLPPTLLSAGTTYWLSLSNNGNGNGDGLFLAANTPSLTPGGSALASYVGFRSGLVGNTSIFLSPALPDPTITMNGISVVPEPTSLGLAGLALVAFVRRKRLGRWANQRS